MSDLKISPNLFLEVSELNRLVKFIKKDGYERIIKSMVKTYGIVEDSENSHFKVTKKAGSENVVVVSPGLAFDSQLRAISLEESLEISIEKSNSAHWLILQYDSTNYEKGTVNITSDGTIQGIGTSFSEVLRGQPNFPTKVKFNSSRNSEEYEVVSVDSDTSAVISGSFVAENNLKYSVIGAFTPGFEPTEENKNIYVLDGCKITVVESSDVPSLDEGQYLLASIEFSSDNGMLITDKRKDSVFNNSYSSQTLIETDDIVSLLKVQKIQSNIFELSIEHGYHINNFELSNSSVFKIKSGECNFFGTGDIPDGFFKNWMLVNKNTFAKAKVDNNVNKDLYISNFSAELVSGDTSEFIIVPPYSNIEYKISCLVSDDEKQITLEPSYHLVTQGSNSNRILICVPFGNVTVGLRYRMIEGEKSTPWQKFSISEYTNHEGEKQSMGDSQIMIINKPDNVELRNYS